MLLFMGQASLTDDNAADGYSDKLMCQLINIRCTRACLEELGGTFTGSKD